MNTTKVTRKHKTTEVTEDIGDSVGSKTTEHQIQNETNCAKIKLKKVVLVMAIVIARKQLEQNFRSHQQQFLEQELDYNTYNKGP